jgi:hypothetical protein
MNRRRQETSGKPQYFTENNEYEFDVTPDQSYSGEVIYYQSQTALSDSNTSNDILTRLPDAYLYGALLASAPFLLDDSRISVWTALYGDAVTGANRMDQKKSGPLVASVYGATP